MQEKNVVICPPCGENVALATKRGLLNKEIFFTTLLPRLTAVLPPQGREITTRGWTNFVGTPSSALRPTSPAGGEVNNGFTLIELLVVVLIIGILAAVAVPQYKQAVLKSQIATFLPLLKTLHQAEETYYLENGSYTALIYKLDVEIPTELTPVVGVENNLVAKGDFMLGLGADDVYLMHCPGESTFEGCVDNRDFALYYKHTHTDHPYAGKMGCISWTDFGKKICQTTQLNEYVIESQH